MTQKRLAARIDSANWGECCGAVMRAIDPSATLAVHCGNGFDAGFSPIKVV
jgi:hypothetical protein